MGLNFLIFCSVSDIVEYIGGYLLAKFPECEISKLLTTEKTREGSFIKAMQKSENALNCPTAEFHGVLLLRVFYHHNREAGSKPLTNVDFGQVLVRVDSDPYYTRLIHTLSSQCSLNTRQVKEFMDDMLCHFIETIGPYFAKFTKQRIMPGSSRFTKGLRKDLKTLHKQ